jgi:hypothetical protein
MKNREYGKFSWLWLMAVVAIFTFPACSDKEEGNGDTGPGQDGQDANWDAGSDPGRPDGSTVTDIPICEELNMVAEPVSPNLLLVVDKSGSMADPTSDGSNRSKMEDTKDALNTMLDFGDGGRIRFGWMPFPGRWGSCNPGTVQVDCADDSVAEIKDEIRGMRSNGGTPTGETLQNADDYQVLYDEERPNFVLLLTDGLPTCPNGGGSDPNPEDDQLTLDAVTSLYSHDIGVFVIGLGEDLNASNPELLNLLAEAGGYARPGVDKYYAANSLEELQQVLDSIGEMVMSCTLKMDYPPEISEWLWVYFDGEPVHRDRDHVDGWDYDPVTVTINFYGPTCDLLKSGAIEKVEVMVGCGPPP